ncbi:hypothetical protein AALT52_02030 [Ligilactobacillus faecis]|uniref:Uncharacterized protein n=1 Tax=Ligilactobacillus faecis TaxID=762833 RepID=A0ABV4DQE7_9LACO
MKIVNETYFALALLALVIAFTHSVLFDYLFAFTALLAIPCFFKALKSKE